jgi:hypothetical protein
MENSIEAVITRTRQCIYHDGLWELLASCILLLGCLTILGAPGGNTGAFIFALGVLALYYIYMGVVFLISGYITFWRYLRREWQDQGDA